MVGEEPSPDPTFALINSAGIARLMDVLNTLWSRTGQDYPVNTLNIFQIINQCLRHKNGGSYSQYGWNVNVDFCARIRGHARRILHFGFGNRFWPIIVTIVLQS